MKYQCNNCKKEFEIPGELETITLSNQYISTPYYPYYYSSPPVFPFNPVTFYNVPPTPPITITIRKSICPYCHQLDFHELKEE